MQASTLLQYNTIQYNTDKKVLQLSEASILFIASVHLLLSTRWQYWDLLWTIHAKLTLIIYPIFRNTPFYCIWAFPLLSNIGIYEERDYMIIWTISTPISLSFSRRWQCWDLWRTRLDYKWSLALIFTFTFQQMAILGFLEKKLRLWTKARKAVALNMRDKRTCSPMSSAP